MNTYRKSADFGNTSNNMEAKFKQGGFEIQSTQNIMPSRTRDSEDRERSLSPGNTAK